MPEFPSGYEIAGHHKPPGPEHVDRDVAAFWQRFAQGGGYDAVLRALEWIAVARLQGVGWTPDGSPDLALGPPSDADGVVLPWWVVSSLAGAIQKARRERLSLDEVLGLSGKGGSRTLWQQLDDTAAKAVRAIEVRHLIEQHGLPLEDAAAAVAERHRITADLVKRNYREIFPVDRPGSRKRHRKGTE